MTLPDLSSLSLERKRLSPYLPLNPELAGNVGRYSLVSQLNACKEWRDKSIRLYALKGESPTDTFTRISELVDRAEQEYCVYGQWLLKCSYPPLDEQRECVRNERANTKVPEMKDKVARHLMAATNGSLNSILSQDSNKALIDVNKALVYDAYKTSHKRVCDWKSMIKTSSLAFPFYPRPPAASPFGASANAYNKHYQSWLKDLLLAPEDTDNAAAKSKMDGSLYSGKHPTKDTSTFVTEHIVAQDWCKATQIFDETSSVCNDPRNVTFILASENSSKGTKPLNFLNDTSPPAVSHVNDESPQLFRLKIRQSVIQKALYAAKLTERRAAMAARAVSYMFLTYPLISDAPSYMDWPSDSHIGSPLYGLQFEYIKSLLEQEPTEWEIFLDWMQWKQYGWHNPFIYETFWGLSVRKKITKNQELMDLLEKRFAGTDAIGQLLHTLVVHGTDMVKEATAVSKELRNKQDAQPPLSPKKRSRSDGPSSSDA